MHIYIYIPIYIYIGIQSLNLKLQLPPTEISFPHLNLESYFINNSSMHCDVNRGKPCTAPLAKIPPETFPNPIYKLYSHLALYPWRFPSILKIGSEIKSASSSGVSRRGAGSAARWSHRCGCSLSQSMRSEQREGWGGGRN